jgi:hypothetical protein
MFDRIRLTLRQHRFETIALFVLCAGLAAAGLVEAWRLNSLNVPPSCLQDGRVMQYWYDGMAAPTPCQLASQRFYHVVWSPDMSIVAMFEQILPFIVGIGFGAPIVAREIETGTAPLSWSLAGSRFRWLLGKIVAVVVVMVPLLLIAGLAADVREGALVPGIDPHAMFDSYAARGVFFVFWGLAAFLGTVALGAIFGRTMPAVMVALVVCVLVRGFWEPIWSHTVLRPFAVAQDSQYQWGSADLFVYNSDQLYLDGKPWNGDLNQWFMEHQPAPPVMASPDASGMVPASNAQTVDFLAPPQPITYIIHGADYWLVTTMECAALLAGSLFCGAIALFWVGRRKPY